MQSNPVLRIIEAIVLVGIAIAFIIPVFSPSEEEPESGMNSGTIVVRDR